MPVLIKIPTALRKVFDDEAEAAFVDVLNQFDAGQRDGFERTLEMHFQAFKEYLDGRLAEGEAKVETLKAYLDGRLAEGEAKVETLKAYLDGRLVEGEAKVETLKAYLDRRLAEGEAKVETLKAYLDRRLAEGESKVEIRLAEYHRSLLRWMFTFFIGTLLTLVGFLLTYLQLFSKM